MNKIKEKLSKKKSCLILLTFFIFSGCSTFTKKNQLLSIQQKRIEKLENQLSRKQKLIDQLKIKKWVGSSNQGQKQVALISLKNLMKQKRWVEALKTSAELKKKYPQSIKLASYRSLIFSKMGLNRQARDEKSRAQNLKAQISSSPSSQIK